MGAQTGEMSVDVRSPSKVLVQVIGPTCTSVAAVIVCLVSGTAVNFMNIPPSLFPIAIDSILNH